MSDREGRSPAEWVTLVLSCGVLALVVGALVVQLRGPDAPADPIARVEQVRRSGSRFHVDVLVVNRGGATAAEVSVFARLTLGDDEIESSQVVDFLAADEDALVVFVFDDDPRDGDLEVAVGSFAEP